MNQSSNSHIHTALQISHTTHHQSDVICNCTQFKLEGLFNPIIKVIPTDDWSKIKAIWIPLLHHDYRNQLERSENITILDKKIDKFGTIQGFLTAPHENYIPYLTTFFNPTWTKDFVLEQIVQASNNVIASISTIINDHDAIIQKTVMGITDQGMHIQMIFDTNNNIIDAYPIFKKE